MEKSHAAVILRSLAVDCLAASICIHVDARNGKYTTELQNFGDIQGELYSLLKTSFSTPIYGTLFFKERTTRSNIFFSFFLRVFLSVHNFLCFCLTGLGKRELDLFIAEINNVDAERHVSNYLLKNGVNCGQSAENPFANIRIQTAPITTLEDVLRLFPLTLWAAEAQKHLPDAANLSTLAAVLLPACGLGKRGLVYNIKCWDEVDPQWLRDQSRADYQALFPASLADLSDKTLVTAALSAPATSTAKRNQAKKRGFSEVALANTVPGDFVSAASLAESQQPVEKARFVVLKHSKKAIAQYFLVSVGADAVVSLLSCICRITVTAYGAQLEHSHPAVLHHRTFAQCNVETTTAIAGGEGGGAPSATAVHFEAMLKEATEWGTTLVHRPMPCSECGFENPGNSIDVLSHPGGGVTTVLPEPPAGASTTSTVLVQVVSMADRAGDAGAFSKTCKGVASSVPGHSFSTCAAATAAKLSPFVSFPVWMLPSVGEAACFTCRDVAFASSAFKDAPTACHISVFATEVLQSIFTAWSFPAAGSVKLELLKRVKFAYLVLQILRGLVSAPSAAKASALASADSGDSMDVVDGSADASAKVVGAGSGASSLLPPVFRLIHFTVEPVATTASASGCTVSFTCAPDLPTCAGCLLVKISYTCSTMRGQGKSINVAEISSVELRDILPGRFERQFSAEELLENHMALLTTALTDYITSCQ